MDDGNIYSDTVPSVEQQQISNNSDKLSFFNSAIQNHKKKVFILVFFVVTLLFVSIVLFFSLQKKETKVITPHIQKTWEIIFSYDFQEDSFGLKKLSLLDKTIKPDYRSAKYSEFELQVQDKDGKILYSQKVPVMTEIPDFGGFSIYAPSSSSANQPSIMPSQNILYTPQYPTESNIILKRSGKNVLNLRVPPNKSKATSSFFQIKQVYADTCKPLVVAFISDGYTDFNQYHKDVQFFEQAFQSTEPYSSVPGMFEFRVIDNSQPIQCSTRGLQYCIQQNTPLMAQIANNKYSDVSKVVVIANAPALNKNDDGILGISSGIGGSFAIFPNNFGKVSSDTIVVARHELLGHAVGLLYDRYVTNASYTNPKSGMSQMNYGLIQNGLRSNCTDNSSGEGWWKTAGSSTVVQGCGNQFKTYGGTALTCNSYNKALVSGGDRNSIMSAGGCGGTKFDAIENYWITKNILPDYAGCTKGPSVSVSPIPTDTPLPTETDQSNQVIGEAFSDANGNSSLDVGEAPFTKGVVITLSGTKNLSATTDSSGNYTFSDIPAGIYTMNANFSGNAIVLPLTFSIPAGNNTTVHINIPVNPNQLINPTPIVIAPTIITPTPSSQPDNGGGSEGFVKGTPIPTPDQYFSCTPDPNCAKSNKSIQLCPLICKPQ